MRGRGAFRPCEIGISGADQGARQAEFEQNCEKMPCFGRIFVLAMANNSAKKRISQSRQLDFYITGD